MITMNRNGVCTACSFLPFFCGPNEIFLSSQSVNDCYSVLTFTDDLFRAFAVLFLCVRFSLLSVLNS